MGSTLDRIQSVDAVTVALPIPRPLQLGPMTVTERRYCVVRVRTDEGLVGTAYGLTRDAPVAEVVRTMVAPVAVGLPADRIASVVDTVGRAAVAAGRVGLAQRALSLLDIALWDIKGKRAGLPVWQLLGGGHPEVDCMLVAGYPTGEPATELGERVAAAAADGHRLLKVARMPDPADMRALLETAATKLPNDARMVVDAAWWWRRAADAVDEIRTWADAAPLAWIEDPMVPEDVEGYARLVAAGVAPIGVGDELTDSHAAVALVQRAGVAVLRIDATTIGGISAAWRLRQFADVVGVPVSCHVYPELHVHVAAAGSPGCSIETFGADDNPFDPAGRLWEGGPTFAPGRATASNAPGLGITPADDLIADHVVGP
ncbi:MAG TPA: mandelate racemase/muconate lactonizing enzyme family protein [Acidimicrobiales bacterium]|nr:mandelate racemase/muconate lactonizing enzyme family protein [Acidimicrobiales bacterium]